MKPVADTLYLVKREETWHYFRRVPKKLVHVLGKTFIKKSLGTEVLQIAKQQRNILNIQMDLKFDAARQALKAQENGETITAKVISLDILTAYVRQHVDRLDKRSAARLMANPPESAKQLDEMTADAQMGRKLLLNRDDPRGRDWIETVSDRVLEENKVRLGDSEAETQFAEIVRRGLIESLNRKIDRYEDRHDRSHHDSMFNPDRDPEVTFGELADMFWAERSEEYRVNERSQKRTDKVLSEMDFLVEVIGGETPVRKIDDDVVQKVRSILAHLPPNRKKIYPTLSVEAAIQQAKKDKKLTLSPVTQGRYLDTMRDILKVGVRKRLISMNPVEGIGPIKKDKVAASEKRRPWKDEQLVGFFKGKFYHSCLQNEPKPYDKKDRGWRFWLPLVMLWSGARPNEITQLFLDDVKKTDKGTWYLDIATTTDDGDKPAKSVKTSTSRRRIPIHAELIKIGFLKFVEQRRKKAAKDQKRLFPEITPDKYGNTATYPTRRLREVYIPAEITLTTGQSLYSLRHNVRDALRRAKNWTSRSSMGSERICRDKRGKMVSLVK